MEAKILKDIEDVVKIQKQNGNWNYDSYMFGLLNGMLLIQSMVAGTPYEPYSAPKKWLRLKWYQRLYFRWFVKPIAQEAPVHSGNKAQAANK